jgi:uncharacterized membrane protein (UPF0127 family)
MEVINQEVPLEVVVIQESNEIIETEQVKIQETYAITKIEESLKVLELEEALKIQEVLAGIGLTGSAQRAT